MIRNLFRRKPANFGDRKKIVILGCGWAGYSMARKLNKSMYDVTVVSPRNYFLFTPLLTTTTVGTLEFRSVVEPIRMVKGINYLNAACSEIDHEKKQIVCKNDKYPDLSIKRDFDKLVIACGATSNTFGTKGVEENCIFLKQISDAKRIRSRIADVFELASLPSLSDIAKKEMLTFVIVGAGPANIEFAAELFDFIKRDAKRLFPGAENYISIHIIEATKAILPMFSPKLSTYASDLIKERDIHLHFATTVKHVEKDSVVLSTGREIKSKTIIWNTGNKMLPFVEETKFKKDIRSKRITTDAFNRVTTLKDKTLDNIFAIGDCSVNLDKPLPPTAQVAQQQSTWLTNALNRDSVLSGEPFKYVHRGTIAYIGDQKALVDAPFGSFKGLPGWVFWNSIYLSKIFSLKNRLAVPANWVLNYALGRSVCRF